jgi:TolA-binding protein
MFERANHARQHGDYAAALEAYRQLQRRFPLSQEARVSYVAMGRMQLDRADAAGALASFDRYEAWGNVDVDAVVMAGRALALDELGAEASSVAWAALLASHPETPYAEHARLRVAARSM